MEKRVKNYLVKSLWLVIILFVIRCWISMPTSTYSFFGSAGAAISITIVFMGIYEKWLWEYDPLEKTPRLSKRYKGEIEYGYDGNGGKKDISIFINQSLLTTSVKIITDEISSNSITSNLIFENGEYVLYYTYITNPKSKFSKDNPIQYGTCRIRVDDKNSLRGTYWTSRQTIGDIYLSTDDKGEGGIPFTEK